MVTYERRKAILSYLKEKRFSTIKELSTIVWASESSIRRDVKHLEEKGYVNLVYGGILLPEYAHQVVPIELRDSSNSSQKDAIAKRAAECIFEGAVIFMDGSSTVKRIMKYIHKFKNLTIITYNQKIFSEYTTRSHIKFIARVGFLTVTATYS